jgi:hypothetical protein
MILGLLESLIELIYVYIHLTDRIDPIHSLSHNF